MKNRGFGLQASRPEPLSLDQARFGIGKIALTKEDALFYTNITLFNRVFCSKRLEYTLR